MASRIKGGSKKFRSGNKVVITRGKKRSASEVASRERSRSKSGRSSMNVFADKVTTSTTEQVPVETTPDNSITTQATKMSGIERPMANADSFTKVASFVKTQPSAVLIAEGDQFRRKEKIEAFRGRVEKIERFERGMSERQEKFESVTGEVTRLRGKGFVPTTARKFIAKGVTIIPTIAESVYVAGMKGAAAVEGFSFKGNSNRVKAELGSSVGKTGSAMATSFNPTTPEGLSNIGLVATGTLLGGRARVKARTFKAKPGTFKTTSTKTIPTTKTITTSTRGSFKNVRGETITFSTKAVQGSANGRGVVRSTFKRGGKVIAKTSKGIKSNVVATDSAFFSETKVFPLDPVRRVLIESGTKDVSSGRISISNVKSSNVAKGVTENVFSQKIKGVSRVDGKRSVFESKSNVKQLVNPKGKTISVSERGIKTADFIPQKSSIGIKGKKGSVSATPSSDLIGDFGRGSTRTTFKPSSNFGSRPSVRPVITSRSGLLSVPRATSIVRPVILTGGRAGVVFDSKVNTVGEATPKPDVNVDFVPDTVPITTSNSIFTNEVSVPSYSSPFSTVFSRVSTVPKVTPSPFAPVGALPFLFPRLSFGGASSPIGLSGLTGRKGKREFTPTFTAANLGLKASKTAFRSGLTLRGKK